MSNTLKRSFNLPDGKVAFGSTVPCRGNGMSLGLYNGTTYGGMQKMSGSQVSLDSRNYGNPVSTSASSTSGINGVLGVTNEASKSGIVADLSGGLNMVIKF